MSHQCQHIMSGCLVVYDSTSEELLWREALAKTKTLIFEMYL